MDKQRDQLSGRTPRTLSGLQLFPLLTVPAAPGAPPWAFPVCRAPRHTHTPRGFSCGLKILWFLGCPMTLTHSVVSGAREVSQSKPILSSQALDTLDQCWASGGLSGVSWGLQTQPLTGDSPCTGTEDSEENRGPESKGSSCRTTEPWQEHRSQRAHPEADSSKESRDLEEAVSSLAPPAILTSLTFGS